MADFNYYEERRKWRNERVDIDLPTCCQDKTREKILRELVV
jgi:hypothetical protein